MSSTESAKESSPKGKKAKKNYVAVSKPLRIRYKHKEREEIVIEAKKLGIDVSKYLRTKIDNGTVRVKYIDSKYEKLLYELNMIGNNLRQVVKLFHTHGDPISAGESLNVLSLQIAELLRQVREKMSDKAA